MFYRLDINDFFDEKYEKLNHASGIGAMGFITSNQSIHLYNDYGLDKKSNTYYLGIGDHYDLTCNVLTNIYGIDKCLVDQYLYNLISIKYWNSEMYKIIALYFPKTITEEEYSFICDLKDYYDHIINQMKITIATYEFGNNVYEYGPDLQTTSNFDPIIDYANKRLDPVLKREVKEKILNY